MTARSKVPILAYHAVEEGPGPLCIDPTAFAAVVETFAAAGFSSVTAGALVEHLDTGTPLPHRTVVFTFDDGYASVHRHAFPVLARHGFTATVFPVTAHLGDTNRWDDGRAEIPTLELMTRAQVEDLAEAGWEIGGHTHTHRPMPSLDDREVTEELARSNDILAELSGTEVRSFAYPFGLHDARVRHLAASVYPLCLEIGADRFSASSPRDRAPRVEGFYVRTATQARYLAGGLGAGYLTVRRSARSLRRLLDRRRER